MTVRTATSIRAVMPLLLLPCPHDMFIICHNQPLEREMTLIFFPFDKQDDGFMDKQHIHRRACACSAVVSAALLWLRSAEAEPSLQHLSILDRFLYGKNDTKKCCCCFFPSHFVRSKFFNIFLARTKSCSGFQMHPLRFIQPWTSSRRAMSATTISID